MRALGQTILQMIAIAVIGTGIALAANAARGKNKIALSKDQFAALRAKPTTPGPAQAAAPTPSTAEWPPKEVEPGDIDIVIKDAQSAETPNEAPDEPADAHPEHGFQTIDVDEVAALLDDPAIEYGGIMFVDARNDAAFEDGHLPGAFQVDHYRLEYYLTPDLIDRMMGATQIVVYCNGGDCEDSILMCDDLMQAGISYDVLYLFEGGWQAWKKGNHPIETGRNE